MRRAVRRGSGGPGRSACRLLALAAAVSGLAALAAAAPLALVFEFERYNETYSGVVADVKPIVRGPLTVRLTSPRSDLTLLANRLELEPAGEGLHRGVIWGRFFGDGELEAEVELGAIPARFEDRVRILEQEKEIEALVRLGRDPAGFLVTLVELPESVTVAIESDLASGLVSFCKGVSLFVIGDAGCDAIERLLANPRLPLPEPGTSFIVRRGYFTDEELAELDGYLDGVEPAAVGAEVAPSFSR